jgi:DNA polymerase/3'-5' exonuclease PolX
MNENIIYFLEDIKSKLDANQKSKKIAYTKIIGIIKDLDFEITIDSKLSEIKGIGKKTEDKIKEFLIDFSEVPPNPKYILEKQFTSITGIGIKKAKILSSNINSFDELFENQDKLLNNKQKLGLKYFKTDNLRIPRAEMIQHKNLISDLIKEYNPNINFQIVGSFRREKEDSGDIDLILTYDTNILKDIVTLFKSKNYILDIYANGAKKFMGWCQLDNISRRLDILFSDKFEYPFSILYFTGSRNCNKYMRSEAIKQGLTLNEHGLYNKKTKEIIDHDFKEERDIFDYLKLEYKSPRDRI